MQGYPLGGILQANVPACKALVFYVGSVLISPQTDQLLTARGLVAAPTAG